VSFFSKYKTFEHDNRIAVADTIKGIPSCHRTFSRFSGALCPFNPLSDHEEQEIIEFMRVRMQTKKDNAVFASNYSGFLQKELPTPLHRTFDELSTIFKNVTGHKNCLALLRANSKHPQEPHCHEVTMTYTMTGLGTVALNTQGIPYNAPLKHIFIMGPDVRHMASQEFPDDHPKLTFVIG
jgi:hypothetical protein